MLAQLETGAELDILGPLGNYFHYEDSMQEALVVAGGLGIAPFMLMMRELEHRNIPMQLFYGVGSSDRFCGLANFKRYAKIHLCTDDGSLGYHGLVTNMLSDHFEKNSINHTQALFACGPTPMLRAVQNLTKRFDIATQVSVETIMGCGFGACVGCAVPMANPHPGQKEYLLACKDGPVFNMKDIIIDD